MELCKIYLLEAEIDYLIFYSKSLVPFKGSWVTHMHRPIYGAAIRIHILHI